VRYASNASRSDRCATAESTCRRTAAKVAAVADPWNCRVITKLATAQRSSSDSSPSYAGIAVPGMPIETRR
jgi:hypothetical protein